MRRKEGIDALERVASLVQRQAAEENSLGKKYTGLPWLISAKESTCNAGDLGSIPGLGRCPGEGKGYQLQCSGLENSMDCIVLLLLLLLSHFSRV